MTRRADETENNFTLLRLTLALLVLFGHFKLLSGTAYPTFPFNLAGAAVDSFFVVSGFLIAGSYERCPGVLSFCVRRAFRLYPMYLCAVLIQTAIMLALLPGGPFSELPATLRYLAANLLLANFLEYDIHGVLSGLHNPGINPSLWTLKIEIGFYLIVPLIYAATCRWGWRALALIFGVSVAYSTLTSHLGDPRLARQLPGQLQFFVAGMALHLYRERLRARLPVSAAIAIASVSPWIVAEPLPPGVRPLIVAAFVFTFALHTPVIRLRSDISYSVYLLHAPLLQTLIFLGLFRDNLLFLTGVVCVAFALSFVTERLVERPGNTLGRRLAQQLGRRPSVVPHLA